MLIDFRKRVGGRVKEKERDIDMREKHQLITFRTRPDWCKPTTQAHALTGNKPATSQFVARHPTD